MKTDKKGIIIPDYLIFIMYLEHGGKCASDVCRELDITYKHLHDLKHTFIDLELIYIVKDSRRQNMFLTIKGKELSFISKQLLTFMNMTIEDILLLIQKGKFKRKEIIDGKKLLEEIRRDEKNDENQIDMY
jgi:hypothetical protein